MQEEQKQEEEEGGEGGQEKEKKNTCLLHHSKLQPHSFQAKQRVFLPSNRGSQNVHRESAPFSINCGVRNSHLIIHYKGHIL